MITIHQRHRRIDRETTCDRNTALCTKVHLAVKTILQLLQARQKSGTAMAGPAVPPTTAVRRKS